MPYLLVLIMLVLVGGGLFLGNYAYTKGLSVESKGNARQEISTEEGYGTVFPNEEVYLQTFDDLILHGALVKKNPEDWVIVCHGYRKDGKSMGEQAAKFSEMGFSVLLPDARGHGESQGSYVGMGWHDHWDIVEWITYLNEHFSPRRILLYGLSMGAATVMMVGGEPLPANVQGIIEDCGFSSIKKVFAYQMKKSYKVPAFPLLNFASGICGFRAKYSLRKDGNVLHQLKKCRIPVLFIHGDQDDYVPFSMMEELYGATKGPKEKLVVHNAIHTTAAKVSPELYWETVKKFIEAHTFCDTAY